MRRKYRNPKGVLALQQMSRTAKQCVLIIALSVLYDQFEVEDPQQLRLFYEIFREEVNAINVWTVAGIERAEKKLKEYALTYVDKKKIRPAPHMMAGGDLSDQVILNSEASCLYCALLVLRRNYKATYKQLDAFLDRYMDFCSVYEDGEQTNLSEIAKELEDIMGMEIIGKVRI